MGGMVGGMVGGRLGQEGGVPAGVIVLHLGDGLLDGAGEADGSAALISRVDGEIPGNIGNVVRESITLGNLSRMLIMLQRKS